MEQSLNDFVGHKVLLVHGTWAQHATWCKEDSTFVQNLKWSDQHEGNRAAIDQILVESLEWSGENSHQARIDAAYGLRIKILNIRYDNPNCKISLVGHSHGGNVIRYALADSKVRQCINSVVTLATPFFNIEKRGVDDWLRKFPNRFIAAVKILLTTLPLPVLIFSYLFFQHLLVDQWELGQWAHSLYSRGFKLFSILLWATLWAPLERFGIRPMQKKLDAWREGLKNTEDKLVGMFGYPTYIDKPIFCIAAEIDEPLLGMRISEKISRLPNLLFGEVAMGIFTAAAAGSISLVVIFGLIKPIPAVQNLLDGYFGVVFETQLRTIDSSKWPAKAQAPVNFIEPKSYDTFRRPSPPPANQLSTNGIEPLIVGSGGELEEAVANPTLLTSMHQMKSNMPNTQLTGIGDKSVIAPSLEIDSLDQMVFPNKDFSIFEKNRFQSLDELLKSQLPIGNTKTRLMMQNRYLQSLPADRNSNQTSTFEAFRLAEFVAAAVGLLTASAGIFFILFMSFALASTWLWRILFLSLLINAQNVDMFAAARNVGLRRFLTEDFKALLLNWSNVLLLRVRVFREPGSWSATNFRLERISICRRILKGSFAHSLIYECPNIAREIGIWIRIHS
jgi:Putative serine esterase (DUF676)